MNTVRSRWFHWILLLVIITASGSWAAPSRYGADMERSDAETTFRKLTALYERERYAEAAEGYEALIESGFTSGPIHFNLGNCYFKLGRLGRAILHYERARRLTPADPSLAANHKYALKVAGVNNAPAGIGDRLAAWLTGRLSPDGFALIAALAVLVLMVILSLSLILRRGAICRAAGGTTGRPFQGSPTMLVNRSIPIVLAVCVILVLLSAWVIGHEDFRRLGIIMREADVRYEPNQTATVYFRLREGSKVELRGRDGEYSLIRRPDGKQGWITGRSVEEI